MKYNKEKEKNYQYWQNEFTPHRDYMIAEKDNEYWIIRNEIFKYINEGDKVLDVGCACGDNLEFSDKIGKKIYYKGVDYAENFILENKKRRPDIDWQEMDARYLDEEDESYNVVVLYDVLDNLEGWEKAIDEAIRVAQDKVIIVMWMDSKMKEKKPYIEKKGFKVKEFEIDNEKCHYHYFLIVDKQKDYLIVDFDDFCQEHNPKEELAKLKEINPAFKVTLFTIPAKTTISMLSWAKKNKDWIELAVHGWSHYSNYECKNWTYEQCCEVLNKLTGSEFVKGFKAPGWQISDGCYKALKDSGYWIADQHYNDDRRPKDLKVYHVGENSYHGHTWDCGCGNGIYEDWDNIVKKVKQAKEFKFISEIITEVK